MKGKYEMAYICESELMAIYDRLSPVLAEHGYASEIAMIRDYMLKISLSTDGEKLGKLIVDYSPKKGSFSFRKDSDLSQEHYDRVTELLTGQIGMTLGATDHGTEKADKAPKPKERKTAESIDFNALPTRYQAFVDGSFIEGQIGYGAVILDRGQIVAELCGRVDDPDAFSARQVGGEIRAVMETLEWCKKHGITEISIFFDFQNIEKWAVGSYKTNTTMTQAYKQYIDACGIRIHWYKVESHTGIALNDRADELAKTGARGLSPQ